MSRRHACLLYGVVALVAAGAGWWFGWQRHAVQLPREGDGVAQLFALTLPDAAGVRQPLAQWRGKVLVINFWAPWCGPCVEEMPELAALQRQLGNRDVQFVGIGIDSGPNIEEFLLKHKDIDYPLLVSGAEGLSLGRALGNLSGGLPFTVVTDRQGKIQHLKLGQIRKQDLLAWIYQVQAQP
ncbi:MAG: TlpA family protein disulfide reductase [Burkholderiaceae bacterium]|nr:MAG: TlpA family protein disulfide reductase [Burkholderiaceae bacterium]